MVWPTLGSRMAEEQNRTGIPGNISTESKIQWAGGELKSMGSLGAVVGMRQCLRS